jgi:hypothetical protein
MSKEQDNIKAFLEAIDPLTWIKYLHLPIVQGTPAQRKMYQQTILRELEACTTLLETPGTCIIWRNNVFAGRVQNRFIRCGVPGQPDFDGLAWDGRTVGIEFKATHRAKLRQEQLAWNRVYTVTGAICVRAQGVECIPILRERLLQNWKHEPVASTQGMRRTLRPSGE